MSSIKQKAEVDKQRTLDFFSSRCLTEQTTVQASAFLFWINHWDQACSNEFAEDAHGLVFFHTWTCHYCTLNNFYKKKSAISYLQTCNINLVFLSLVYSSTNKGKIKTARSYTSVVHGLLHPSYCYARKKFGLSISAGSFIPLISQSNAVGSRKNEPVWHSQHVLDAMFLARGHKLFSLVPSLPQLLFLMPIFVSRAYCFIAIFKKITTFFNLEDMFRCYKHHCQLHNVWKTVGLYNN